MDDQTREGYAQLEQARRSTFKPGEITLLVPETDEMHQMDNCTDRPTVEIHVYGTDLRGLDRHRYDLQSGRIIPFATEKYDNCSCLRMRGRCRTRAIVVARVPSSCGRTFQPQPYTRCASAPHNIVFLLPLPIYRSLTTTSTGKTMLLP